VINEEWQRVPRYNLPFVKLAWQRLKQRALYLHRAQCLQSLLCLCARQHCGVNNAVKITGIKIRPHYVQYCRPVTGNNTWLFSAYSQVYVSEV